MEMARTPLIRNTVYPYHLIARSNNKEWFYLSLPEVWNIFLEVLKKPPLQNGLKIHAFVLMSNHFHLLASSTDGQIDKAMHYLLRETCRKVNQRANRINHLFGGPYKWSLITTPTYYSLCLKYIYNNPVRAGICGQVEEYPFSSVSTLWAPEKLPFLIEHWKWSDDLIKWGDQLAILAWLNSDYPMNMMADIKKGLKKSQFEIPKNRSSRKPPIEYWEHLRPIMKQEDGFSDIQK